MSSEVIDVKDCVELELPNDALEALRATEAVVGIALTDLGRLHLREAADRARHEKSSELLRVAEQSARHALQQQSQVQKTVIHTLGVGDGAWDLDLDAGKLVRTDGQS